MQLAERLYTQGYISYPRTETNSYPENFDLRLVYASLILTESIVSIGVITEKQWCACDISVCVILVSFEIKNVCC